MSRATRSLGVRRGVAAATTVLALGVALVGAQAVSAAPRSQALVILLGGHVARVGPNAHARRMEAVGARRPLTKVRTVLPVVGRGGRDDAWVRVLLPGRPNGHSGWISTNRTRAGITPWRIRVATVARRVIVFHEGRAVRRFPAIVGKPSTPTPRGTFFVEEALKLSDREAGTPFALATSARSNVLQEFDGGPGQIALHGTAHLSGALGSAVSHGCVRLSRHAIAWLATRIGAGVPVTIGRDPK